MTLSWYAVIFAEGQNCKALSFATCSRNQTTFSIAQAATMTENKVLKAIIKMEMLSKCGHFFHTFPCLLWPCWNSIITWPQNCNWEVFSLFWLSAEPTWQVRSRLSAEGLAEQFPRMEKKIQRESHPFCWWTVNIPKWQPQFNWYRSK